VETRTLPRSTRLVALLVGFIGIVLLSAPNLTGLDAEALGVILILLAVLGHSVATTVYAPLQQTYGSMRVALWLVAVSAVLLLPPGLIGLADSSFEPGPFVALLILGVIGTGLVWFVYLGLIGRVGAVRASVAGYFIPIVALVLGVLILDETVAFVQVVGVVVALVGGYMLSKSKGSAEPAAEREPSELGAEVRVNLDASCATTERPSSNGWSAEAI
jgi:drug/metabolite transporter (DMT)-like permease